MCRFCDALDVNKLCYKSLLANGWCIYYNIATLEVMLWHEKLIYPGAKHLGMKMMI